MGRCYRNRDYKDDSPNIYIVNNKSGYGTVYKYKEKIEEISNITIPSPANNITKASTLCFVARDKMLANDQVYNCYNINPMYIRKSQAEEQYEEKQKRLKDGK